MTTEKFIRLGRLEARALGLPALRFEILSHPFAGLPPDMARSRGTDVARNVIEQLRQTKG